jgi:hypothetical protein
LQAQNTNPIPCPTDKNNSKWSIGVQINTPERKIPNIEDKDQNANVWEDGYLYNGDSHNGSTKDKTYAVSVVGNYYLKDNNFLRIKAGINNVDIVMTDKPFIDPTGTTLSYDNAWKKRMDFNVSPGIGYSIAIKHFNFYAGFELPYTHYGQAQFYAFWQNNDAKTGALISTEEMTGTIFKAYSIGIGNFIGFSFSFRSLSIGGEITYAFLYKKLLSASTWHNLDKDFINNTTTSSDLTYNPTMSNFDMSKIKGSIMLTYSF